MNKRIKSKWVKALRSGRYEQGSGYLKAILDGEETVHCCLGVLCELAPKNLKVEESGPEQEWPDLSAFKFGVKGKKASMAMPSKEILDWCGLRRIDSEDLAGLNDNGDTFEQIADYIEENL